MLGSLIPGRFIGKDIMAVDLGADTLKIAHATRVVPGRVKIASLVSRDIRGLSDEAIVGADSAGRDHDLRPFDPDEFVEALFSEEEE